MKRFLSGLGIFVAFVAVLLGLTWILQGNDFFLYKASTVFPFYTRQNPAVRRGSAIASDGF